MATKKKTYSVAALATISVYTDVQATSKEEAIELAKERSMMGLCYRCGTGAFKEEWCPRADLDGEPFDLRVEE